MSGSKITIVDYGVGNLYSLKKAFNFFDVDPIISEDPEVIKNYIKRRKEPIKKVVYSSAITGKLFNTKGAVIEDFKKRMKDQKLLTRN